MHADEGCVLLYNSKYKKISIQCRQTHGEWNPLSEASTKTTTVGDITEFEVNHLNLGYKYDFRGFFENANGEILLLTSKESIKIKSNLLQYLFIINIFSLYINKLRSFFQEPSFILIFIKSLVIIW